MVRVYIRLLLCFRFPYESLRQPAEQQICTALQATLAKWPFLAGRLGPQPRSTEVWSNAATASSSTASRAPSSSISRFHNSEYQYPTLIERHFRPIRNPRQEPLTEATNFTLTSPSLNLPPTGLLELKYPHPTPPVTSAAPDGFRVFRARALTAADGWEASYEDCCTQRMRPGILRKELLSSLPEHPVDEGRAHPALGVQANWIDGGLILCFAFHHAAVDGAGVRTFLETFARHMRDLRDERPLREEVADGDDAALRWALQRSCKGKGVPEEFDFASGPPVPMPDPVMPGDVSKILRFPAKGLKVLKRMVMEELEVMRQPGSGEDVGAVTYVSTTDCVCALMWVAIMRTRYTRGRINQSMNEHHKLLKAEEETRFNIAVNARRRLTLSLYDDYIGNAIVVTVAKAKVGEIVGFPRPGL
ncbi:hypothetical protein GTA08_BOTSDO12836 [Neofusicoccum parvum]|uniref:Uncharacterized protein n=1 Tax=Neofusicoccum parvum TaxID=310453 RepID=A0ACB5S832_9PEZI|nr:hypothetical protein GTA08_BOTSDO12836 [Neofusicoccum parvum]